MSGSPRRPGVVLGTLLAALGTALAVLPLEGRPAGPKEATMPKVRVYMASPYGFAPSTTAFMREQYYEAVRKAGGEVVDPWRRTVSPQPDRAELLAIGRANAKDIEGSDGMVASLDGADVDSGTAAEIGYAAALGKWIIGYRGDLRQTGEGAGVTVNLQVESFIQDSGGEVVRSLDDLTAAVQRRIAQGPSKR